MKNREAKNIREYGRNMLIISIIFGVLWLVLSIFETKLSTDVGWSCIGFGLLIYTFSRGFSEVIELLHHIAMGIGTVDPSNETMRPVKSGFAILDIMFKHASHTK